MFGVDKYAAKLPFLFIRFQGEKGASIFLNSGGFGNRILNYQFYLICQRHQAQRIFVHVT